MATKDLAFSFEARERMLRGVETLAGAVRVTFGPKGRTVALGRPFGTKITKDGVSVAREVELADPFQNIGVRMVRETALRSSHQAGDGTTTTVVLAHAIFRGGVRAVAAGMNPMDLKRGIDKAVDAVVAELKRNARTVTDSAQIAHIGAISANGDRAIGDTIAAAMRQVGNDGVIAIEDGTTQDTELEVVRGIQFDRSFTSPHFITDRVKRLVQFDDAYVLLSDKKLASIEALLPLLEKVVAAQKPLLIVADEFEGEVTAALVVNKLRGSLKVAAVKAPAYGELRRSILSDIALMTGGKVFSDDLGTKLENLSLDDLGRARTVTIDAEGTTIAGGAASPSAIEARIAALRHELAGTTSDFDREKLSERVARLSGGIATIRVGGATEVEVRERTDRIRNAMHATRAAVEEGVLPGGGVALLRAGRAARALATDSADENAGIAIVGEAISWPARQIAINAGEDGPLVVARILARSDDGFGYDARVGDYGDMIAKGIIDPAKVVRTALQGAASIAGLLITTECVVAERPGPPPPELPGHDHDENPGAMEF